ncbi:MarR family transcriptional regulator [Emcibacter sp.]|uniref:MarR family winged helix-turn-helix transcriptional regulator n=1 Tax=Emcibacter sp. TaxID=1979954 RepID=UPI002AA7A060|nr:MarR family transcriptional regulator [Emcibacter sp.]
MNKMKNSKGKAEANLSSGKPVSLKGLDDLLGYQLKRAQIVLQRDFLETLAPIGLTQRQGATLWLIKENPAISQSELATVLLMDRATMLVIIDKLSTRGLVKRKRSKVDRRRHELCLTEEGEALLAQAKELIKGHEERFKKLFSGEELASFFKFLEVIASRS